MRDDIVVEEVLEKCSVLKNSGLWSSEPKLRPRAWLSNFDDSDKGVAALLLDNFIYLNQKCTDSLFFASYNSIADGLIKGPHAPLAADLFDALHSAVFIPVSGEKPNPSDSGYIFCRKARQILQIPEENIVDPSDALLSAIRGNTVVFLDDFIGSGDQFLKTWRRPYGRVPFDTFERAHKNSNFTAIYLSLIATEFGLQNINFAAPSVAVCLAHILGPRYTVQGLGVTSLEKVAINNLLSKYSKKLRPKEDYIANNPDYVMFGYKKRGLMISFEHSTPDATLPIFWAPGEDEWEPLVERA